MKAAYPWVIGAVLAALAGGAGYYLGHRNAPVTVNQASPSPVTAGTLATASAPVERKLLYYRNPMGLPDTSPTPKKDPMGMDYIAVYSGEAGEEPQSSAQLRISTEKIQKLGVRTEAVQLRALDKTVRASGRIEPDERRLFTIAPKFEGYVERLHVNVTGQPVSKGQPLLEVYSPELVSAQREYAVAAQGVDALYEAPPEAQSGMKQLAESSLQRLKNWDISEEQIKALVKTGVTQRTLIFRSPASGIVMEKKAVQGMRFMPGEMLYQVADLSHVWVIADVFEQDIALVKAGSKASVRINAYPDKEFSGTVTYVYPTLKAETRTIPVRIELANPALLLKPAMFAQVEVQVSPRTKVLTVPLSAVIDSGTRQIVLIQHAEGRFQPHEVRLGARSDTYVEVLGGVQEGDQVVVTANFLIDAESNLKAAVGGFASAPPPASQQADATGGQVQAKKLVVHRAEGSVDSIDTKEGAISLSHGPVASLKWPAMTMDFKAANPSLIQSLKSGAKVSVEFVERQPGEWVITTITPLAAGKAALAPGAATR